MNQSEPILVVMAAGMGSRYGGAKQIDRIGRAGEILTDYSLFDARRAGFKRAVFLIAPHMEADFQSLFGKRKGCGMDLSIALQRMDDLPAGLCPPAGRSKPWGTAHAVYCCRSAVDAPFATINADDYYGPEAFAAMYEHLRACDGGGADFAMVGYDIANTLSESGAVSRGVCSVRGGLLADITERTHIRMTDAGPAYSEDSGATFTAIPARSVVSMNLWGFTPAVFDMIADDIPPFFAALTPATADRAELYLPETVRRAIRAGRAHVTVYTSRDTWYGMTYREDRPLVQAALNRMTDEGLYPTPLWKSYD